MATPTPKTPPIPTASPAPSSTTPTTTPSTTSTVPPGTTSSSFSTTPSTPTATTNTPISENITDVNPTVETSTSKSGVVYNPGILSLELFGQNRVIVLKTDDFKIDTDHAIDLKTKDCILILFHTNNEESKNLAIIWNSVAQQIVGPKFAAVNLLTEQKLASAFNNLNNANSSYKPFELKGIPFILVYQNGTPVGFYNGERAVQPIADFSLTLACKASYFEPLQYTAGIQVDNNISMTGWKEYDGTRKTSLDYKTNDSIRKYDATKKPVIVGSTAFVEEGKQVTSQEEAEGIKTTAQGLPIASSPGVNTEEQQSAQLSGVNTNITVPEANISSTGEKPVSPK